MNGVHGSSRARLAASPELGGPGRKGRTGGAAAASPRGAQGPPASRTAAGKVIPTGAPGRPRAQAGSTWRGNEGGGRDGHFCTTCRSAGATEEPPLPASGTASHVAQRHPWRLRLRRLITRPKMEKLVRAESGQGRIRSGTQSPEPRQQVSVDWATPPLQPADRG